MHYIFTLLSDPRVPVYLAVIAAMMRIAYAITSHIVAPYPRARAIVEAIAAMSPDVLRATLQLVAAVTGKTPERLDARIADEELVRLRQRIEALEATQQETGDRPTLTPGEPT